MKRERSKFKLFQRTTAAMLLVFMLLLAVAGSQAWYLKENSVGMLSGGKGTYTVELSLNERNVYGDTTDRAVAGAAFRLYKVEETEGDAYVLREETPVEEELQTDNQGVIRLEQMERGNYVFYQTNLPEPYAYDIDESEEDIREYPFTVGPKFADEDRTVQLRVYNQRLAGQMTITKTVINKDGSDLSEEQKEQGFIFKAVRGQYGEYEYSIDGGEIQKLQDDQLVLKHGQTAVFERLPAGMFYAIEQEPVPGYETRAVNDQNEIPLPTEAEGITVEFINIYDENHKDTAPLIISKALTGEKESEDDFVFRMTIGEDENREYPYQIQRKDGNSTEEVMKSGGIVRLRAGEEAVFRELPVGAVWETEELDPEGYIPLISKMSGTVLAVEENRADFINHKISNTGELRINKEVIGEPEEVVFGFQVRFSDGKKYPYMIEGTNESYYLVNGKLELSPKETAVFRELPEGITWQVLEEDRDGYTASISMIEGKIIADKMSYAQFVNYRNDPEGTEGTGELLIAKSVVGKEKGQEFRFKVVLDGAAHDIRLKAGEELSLKDLPAGTYYSVEELDAEGYTASVTRVEGQIPQNGQAAARFVNYADEEKADTGRLKVEKQLAGDDADSDDTFAFQAEFSDGKSYPYMLDEKTYETSNGRFTLQGGQSLMFIGIPEGVYYTVTELPDDNGYTPGLTEQQGGIAAGQESGAAFINYKDKEPDIEEPEPENPEPEHPEPEKPEPEEPELEEAGPEIPDTGEKERPGKEGETPSSKDREILNNRIGAAKTGDSSVLVLWIVLLAASAVTALYIRKKK